MALHKGILVRLSIMLAGVGLGLSVWLASAIYDCFVLDLGSFLACLVSGSEGTAPVRVAALVSGIIAGTGGQVFANQMLDKRRLQTLFERSNDGFLLISPNNGRIVDANKRASELLGYSLGELKTLSLEALHPHDYRIALDFLRHVLDTGSGMSDQVSCRTKIGGLMPAEVSASAIDLGGQMHILVSLRDITERLKVNASLQKALQEAQAANRAKSEFLANISHELRTPLNAIVGFSELIASERLGPHSVPAYREYADHINDSGLHLLDVINNVLDLARIESGTDTLCEDAIDVTDLARSAICAVAGRAASGNVQLVLDAPEDLAPVLADQRKVKQILVNLLSNGIKFTPACGTVTLRCACIPGAGHVFEVCDTGIGMAQHDIPKALAPFQQVESSWSRRYEGTGLGLRLASLLIEQHGGSLAITSEPGGGTKVVIRFPKERIFSPQACERPAAGANRLAS